MKVKILLLYAINVFGIISIFVSASLARYGLGGQYILVKTLLDVYLLNANLAV